MRAVLLSLLAVLLTACGSRSALIGGSNPTGSGTGGGGESGSASGSGGASGGSGGVSGASGAIGGIDSGCLDLEQVPPLVTVGVGDATVWDGYPVLTASSDDGERVTVVNARTSDGAQSQVYGTFSPWSDWPWSGILSPAPGSVPVTATEVFAGRGIDGHFGLLFENGGFGSAQFAPYVDASSGQLGPTVTLTGQQRRFVVHGPSNTQLVGVGSAKSLIVHVVKYSGSGSAIGDTSLSLGCSDGGVVSDAAQYLDGWLLAMSDTANGVFGCAGEGEDNGESKYIDVVYVTADGVATPITSIDVGGFSPILRAVPHPQGITILFRGSYDSKFFAPLRWLRVDVPHALVVGPTVVTNALGVDYVAAAPMGRESAVVWTEGFAGPHPIRLAIWDESGSPSVKPIALPGLPGSVAAIGAPHGDSVVVAWSTAEGVGSPTRVQLARFDCVAGE